VQAYKPKSLQQNFATPLTPFLSLVRQVGARI